MKLRFSLRTLLIFVAGIGAICWAYWVGWPWWQIQRERREIQREQARFVESLENLKAGMSILQAKTIPQYSEYSHCKVLWMDLGERDALQPCSVGLYIWPDAFYLVHCVPTWKSGASQFDDTRKCLRIEVFKSPAVPPDYRSRGGADFRSKYGREPEYSYESDLLDIVLHGTPNETGIKYELIYADPPQKPGANLQESKPSDASQGAAE
jgi:hypothetical protein